MHDPAVGEVLDLDDWRARVGGRLGVSDWFDITQQRVDAYAACIEDDYWIHTDPSRAATESPTGGTLAHGLLTLSLLSAMSYQALPQLRCTRMVLNYGFDRVRFVAPVPVGSRVRGIFDLTAAEERTPNEITVTCAVTVEIEGAERPALVAVWMHRRFTG